MTDGPILELDGIEVRYGGVPAVARPATHPRTG